MKKESEKNVKEIEMELDEKNQGVDKLERDEFEVIRLDVDVEPPEKKDFKTKAKEFATGVVKVGKKIFKPVALGLIFIGGAAAVIVLSVAAGNSQDENVIDTTFQENNDNDDNDF